MPNKYQEALNYIVRNSCYKKTICSECNMHNSCHIPAKRYVDILQKLVDKATPTNPNIYGDGYDEQGELIYDMYDCPRCGKSYEIDYEKYRYCPNCGQAIDWSDKYD